MYKDNCLSDVEMYFKTLIRYSVIKNECRGTHFEELLKSFIANCVLLLLLYEIRGYLGINLPFVLQPQPWTLDELSHKSFEHTDTFSSISLCFSPCLLLSILTRCPVLAQEMQTSWCYPIIFHCILLFLRCGQRSYTDVCCAFTTHTSSVIVWSRVT